MSNILKVILAGDASGLNRSLSTAQQKLTAFGKSAQNVGRNLTLKLTAPILLAGGQAVKAASDFERLQTSLSVLTGGAAQGAKAFERLVKFSAQTPFQLADLAAVNNQLIGFGLSADDAFNSLKLLGDVSAVAGSDLSRVAIAFGQSAAAGRVMTQDLNQFVNNGIPIFQILGEITGKNAGELRELASEGLITFDLLRQGFEEATSDGGRFENGMQKLSKTFQGQFSTLKDNLNIALADFGKLLLPLLTKVLKLITGLARKFTELDTQTKKNVAVFGMLAAAIGPVLVIIGSLTLLITPLALKIALITAAVVGLVLIFNNLRNVFNDFSSFVKQTFLNAVERIKEAISLLVLDFNTLKEKFNEIITNKFKANFDEINKKYDEQAAAIRKATQEQIDYNKKQGETERATNDLKSTLEVLKEVYEELTNQILPDVTKANDDVTESLKKPNTVLGELRSRLEKAFSPKVLSAAEKYNKIFSEQKKNMEAVNELQELRASILNEKVNNALSVGNHLMGIFSSGIEALSSGGNFFQGVINSLKQLAKRLVAAVLAAQALQLLLPVLGLGGASDSRLSLGSLIGGFTGLGGLFSGNASAPNMASPNLGNALPTNALNNQNVNLNGNFRLDGQDLVLALENANRNRGRLL